ncbi:hypothetical protein CALVIDRAFT_563141 [Calocera viscosa TUFC12733]|uniref:Uncharacterized protein n=1 Tax=Calocera viscosa (strain TUFC12733) TaxID=1330018 RepID=A0A167N524_CALVF|nr:hypothetical protein CALVIDRAFT_563141 [Calocera viscosa TUFC12733]
MPEHLVVGAWVTAWEREITEYLRLYKEPYKVMLQFHFECFGTKTVTWKKLVSETRGLLQPRWMLHECDLALHETVLGNAPLEWTLVFYGKVAIFLLHGGNGSTGSVAIVAHLAQQAQFVPADRNWWDIVIGNVQPSLVIPQPLLNDDGEDISLPETGVYEYPASYFDNGRGGGAKTTVLRPLLSFVGKKRVFILLDFNRMATFEVITAPEFCLTPEHLNLNNNESKAIAKLLLPTYGPWYGAQGAKVPEDIPPSLNPQTDWVWRHILHWVSQIRSRPFNNTYLLTVLSKNNENFPGIGEWEANDLCYFIARHPLMPVSDFCKDSAALNATHNQLLEWGSSQFLSKFTTECYPRTTHINPLHFNEAAHQRFLSMYDKTYYKSSVKVPRGLAMIYERLGYFDPSHTIGEMWNGTPTVEATGRYDSISRCVYRLYNTETKKVLGFTCIQAKLPLHWKDAANIQLQPSGILWSDAAHHGFQALIGPMDFHYTLATRLWQDPPAQIIVKGTPQRNPASTLFQGYRPTIPTSRPGRPAKLGTMKKAVKLQHQRELYASAQQLRAIQTPVNPRSKERLDLQNQWLRVTAVREKVLADIPKGEIMKPRQREADLVGRYKVAEQLRTEKGDWYNIGVHGGTDGMEEDEPAIVDQEMDDDSVDAPVL